MDSKLIKFIGMFILFLIICHSLICYYFDNCKYNVINEKINKTINRL
uniref:Uncharacterized protein n=1 Tax=Florenciella sp. virus SA2 TaxID=3240092 RepID=A0AB39J9K2_9VIRU